MFSWWLHVFYDVANVAAAIYVVVDAAVNFNCAAVAAAAAVDVGSAAVDYDGVVVVVVVVVVAAAIDVGVADVNFDGVAVVVVAASVIYGGVFGAFDAVAASVICGVFVAVVLLLLVLYKTNVNDTC